MKPVAVLLFFLCAIAAHAEWKFEEVTQQSPAVKGQPLQFTVRLSGSGEGTVHVAATCDQDAEFQPVMEASATTASERVAVFRYKVPASADTSQLWRFNFQIVDNGTGKARHPLLVQVYSVAPTPLPTPAMASSAPAVVIAAPPAFTAASQPAIPVTPATMPASSPAESQSTPAPMPSSIHGADLQVAFVDAPEIIQGAPGEKRAIRYVIRNLGDEPCSQTLVRYGSDLQSTFDSYARPLRPQEQLSGLISFEIYPEMTQFWIEAIPRGTADSNSANNKQSRRVSITPASPYELTLVEMALTHPQENSSEPVEVRLLLKNPGPAAIDKPFEVSVDGFVGGRIRQTIQSLPSANLLYVSFRGVPDPSFPEKNHLFAMVDSRNVLQERDEADNFATLNLASEAATQSAASQPGIASMPATTQALTTQPAVTPPPLEALGQAGAPQPMATPLETPVPLATPTPTAAEQDVAILSLELSPQKPLPGMNVVFIITTNAKTVLDTSGAAHDVAEYLSLDPRNNRMERVSFVYNSSMPDGQGHTIYRFVASYAYAKGDQGLERHARIRYAPPVATVPDADAGNNEAIGIVQIGK